MTFETAIGGCIFLYRNANSAKRPVTIHNDADMLPTLFDEVEPSAIESVHRVVSLRRVVSHLISANIWESDHMTNLEPDARALLDSAEKMDGVLEEIGLPVTCTPKRPESMEVRVSQLLISYLGLLVNNRDPVGVSRLLGDPAALAAVRRTADGLSPVQLLVSFVLERDLGQAHGGHALLPFEATAIRPLVAALNELQAQLEAEKDPLQCLVKLLGLIKTRLLGSFGGAKFVRLIDGASERLLAHASRASEDLPDQEEAAGSLVGQASVRLLRWVMDRELAWRMSLSAVVAEESSPIPTPLARLTAPLRELVRTPKAAEEEAQPDVHSPAAQSTPTPAAVKVPRLASFLNEDSPGLTDMTNTPVSQAASIPPSLLVAKQLQRKPTEANKENRPPTHGTPKRPKAKAAGGKPKVAKALLGKRKKAPGPAPNQAKMTTFFTKA